jgi:predicted dehydrogenase
MSVIRAVLFGAGDRGTAAYAPYALEYPDELQFVAVVEHRQSRRENFARLHGIPPDQCYERGDYTRGFRWRMSGP